MRQAAKEKSKMADKNEKNVKAIESTTTATEVMTATPEKRLIVERDKFMAKDGREMWGYAVHGKGVNGRETKVDFNAYDQGGYEVLDMVFDIKPTAELQMHDESMTDSETGEVRTYTVYEVANVDEDGDELKCRIKPARDSDKSILAYLLKKLNRQANASKTA